MNENASQNEVIFMIGRDRLAGRFKDPGSGDTAYHILLKSNVSSKFLLETLQALVHYCPSGAAVFNAVGNLPLHTYLCQNNVFPEAVLLLMEGMYELLRYYLEIK